ncbi:MAG: YbaN family protein [Sporomusaceae bacterium]|nr:YbaN family protein [Sporomusaceae bacterium]
MKPVYIGFGFLFLGLGAVGAVLPLLPTVPFLLLASACFSKGSDRFYGWFTATSLYQNHLKDFEQNRTMPLKSKLYILSFSTTMLLIPLFTTANRWAHIAIILLLIVKYYIFAVKIKTAK